MFIIEDRKVTEQNRKKVTSARSWYLNSTRRQTK